MVSFFLHERKNPKSSQITTNFNTARAQLSTVVCLMSKLSDHLDDTYDKSLQYTLWAIFLVRSLISRWVQLRGEKKSAKSFALFKYSKVYGVTNELKARIFCKITRSAEKDCTRIIIVLYFHHVWLCQWLHTTSVLFENTSSFEQQFTRLRLLRVLF